MSFICDTLQPIATRIEQELVYKLFPEQADIIIEFDFKERKRGDWASTMQGIAVGRQWGVLTANEARDILDINPLDAPSANITWAPVNMQNSEWMMDKESIQDQPVDAAPAAPTSRIKRLEESYMLMFADAMGRCLQRPVNTRSKAITQIFDPVIRSLAAAINADEKYVATVLAGMSKRAAHWTSTETEGPQEFQRVVRTLYINAMRDRAAWHASREVESLQTQLPAPEEHDET